MYTAYYVFCAVLVYKREYADLKFKCYKHFQNYKLIISLQNFKSTTSPYLNIF